ncbi:hypothetical protein ATCC90586_003247 [Pythium insidiosum]|nr:hypothetical protein ATCC90586_003247 [Pythium insidiosum]
MIQSLFDDDNAEDDTDSHAQGSEDRDETANDEASDTSEDEASESSRLVQTKYLERKSKSFVEMLRAEAHVPRERETRANRASRRDAISTARARNRTMFESSAEGEEEEAEGEEEDEEGEDDEGRGSGDAKQVEPQYAAALTKCDMYSYEENEDGSEITVIGAKKHTVHKTDWRCDCDFALTMLLPCRHAIAARKHLNVPGFVIPLRRIDERWTSAVVATPTVASFVYNDYSCMDLGDVANEEKDIDNVAKGDEAVHDVGNNHEAVHDAGNDVGSAGVTTEMSQSLSQPHNSDFEDASVRLQVKLNPRARKTGRPPIAKSQTVSRAKRERLHFNQSESARRELGEVTLFDLAKSLDEEKPSVADTLKRLEKIPTKFMQNDIDDAIFVGSQSTQGSQLSQLSQVERDAPVEVVKILDAGMFNRQQVQTMMHLLNLRAMCEDDTTFIKWLVDVVCPSVPLRMQEGLAYMHWRHAGMPDAKPGSEEADKNKKPKAKKDPQQRLVPTLANRIATLAASGGTSVLLLPINFGNPHWCGMIVDVPQKRVSYYDSLNSNMYKSACDDLAQVIVKDALPDFSVVSINSHIQFDGFSCGFYVGMKFWSYVDHTIPKDLTQHSINARHFELLNFILTGEKPIQEQAIALLPPSRAVLNVPA